MKVESKRKIFKWKNDLLEDIPESKTKISSGS